MIHRDVTLECVAQSAAAALREHGSLEGVVVVCIRKNKMGAAVSAPDMPIDVVLGAVVQVLGGVRSESLKKELVEELTQDEGED